MKYTVKLIGRCIPVEFVVEADTSDDAIELVRGSKEGVPDLDRLWNDVEDHDIYVYEEEK